MLKTIQEQVRFARARFGQYDLIDFVAVLIGYVLSDEPTLLAFYERLTPWADAFMAPFGRDRLPHRSTLWGATRYTFKRRGFPSWSVFWKDVVIHPVANNRMLRLECLQKRVAPHHLFPSISLRNLVRRLAACVHFVVSVVFCHTSPSPTRTCPHLAPTVSLYSLSYLFHADVLREETHGEKEEEECMMASRQLMIEQPSPNGKSAPVRIRLTVHDETPIGPWIAALAASFQYPLVDPFGRPILYRLYAVSDKKPLPHTGCFADARFPSGHGVVLEAETSGPVLMQERSLFSRWTRSGFVFPTYVSRRSFLVAGTLATFSLLGFGSGVTTAFGQHLLGRRQIAHPPIPTASATVPISLSVSLTFTQHQQTVNALTWSPDGRMLASGGDDHRVYAWHVNGSLLHASSVATPVQALAWSPDGHSIVVGAGNDLSFFDAQTGVLLDRVATASVMALGWTGVLSTSAPLALSAGTDRTATVWNGQSHHPQVIFRRHTTAIEALAVLGETVATASQGGVIRVWGASSGQELHGYYTATQQPLRAIAFSSSGTLAAAGDDGIVFLWSDGRTCTQEVQATFGRQCIDTATRLLGHTRPVRALAFSPDGTLLATGGDDKMLILWSVPTMTLLLILPQHDVLAALVWSSSGPFLAGAVGSRVILWQIHQQ